MHTRKRNENNDSSTLLRAQFDALLASFPLDERIGNDPIRYVRQFTDPADLETAGLISAVFAYGNVNIILRTVGTIFESMHTAPAAFVRHWYKECETSEDPLANPFISSFLPGFYYRFNNTDDLRTLLWGIGKVREEKGSLENLFLEGYSGSARDMALSPFASGLEHFSHTFQNLALSSPFQNRRNFDYLFPRPSKGSPCKRLCLYLRWMCRHDEVDPGCWASVKRSDLIIPLDAHVQRIGKYLGFTSRKNASWEMAEEITAALRLMDPEDPVRYDFVICHLGISGMCPNRFDPAKCSLCPVSDRCFRSDGEKSEHTGDECGK